MASISYHVIKQDPSYVPPEPDWSIRLVDTSIIVMFMYRILQKMKNSSCKCVRKPVLNRTTIHDTFYSDETSLCGLSKHRSLQTSLERVSIFIKFGLWIPKFFLTIRDQAMDIRVINGLHDDVIQWKHFPRYWPFVRGIHRSPVNSPHKGQWRGALMISLICAWINGWLNNREPGDLRRHPPIMTPL